MEYMEDLVLEEGTENTDTMTADENIGEVEQITPPEKTYTQAEVDSIVGERLAREKAKGTRREARIRKEYDDKYGQLERVLKAGTGKDSVEEMTSTFADFYKGKGVHIPTEPNYNERDIEILANAEAKAVIEGGLDEVIEEVDRLASIGFENMTARDKAVFSKLAEFRQKGEAQRELNKIGVTEEVYNSPEFKEFASQFNSNTPITQIYEIYNKMQPKKEVRTIGSMKNTETGKVKDYYTPEEIERLTEDDLDDPAVWDAVRRSMTGR